MTATVYLSNSPKRTSTDADLKRACNRLAAVLDSAIFPIAVGMTVMGTGSYITHEYVKRVERYQTSSAPTPLLLAKGKQTETLAVKAKVISASDLIVSLKDSFGLGASDLSRLLGVSRQAVYNWADGDAISPDHNNTLTRVGTALKSIQDAGLEITGSSFRRKLIKGRTFAEMIAQGVSVADAAQTLRELLKTEADERHTLSKRLGTKTTAHPSIEADFLPVYDERT